MDGILTALHGIVRERSGNFLFAFINCGRPLRINW